MYIETMKYKHYSPREITMIRNQIRELRMEIELLHAVSLSELENRIGILHKVKIPALLSDLSKTGFWIDHGPENRRKSNELNEPTPVVFDLDFGPSDPVPAAS